ncbi:MAG TPA: hypothetical protein VIA80_02440 [Hyphomonadaceae bacterium]|jgi:hypothetical protein
MKLLLASSALALAFAVAPAYGQQPQQPPVTAETSTEGSVKVEGIAPSQVLGAIETEKLTDKAEAEATAAVSAKPADEQPPENRQQVTVDTKVEQRADATVETRTETITPVSGRPALDPDNPIAPEVQEVVAKKKRYTTADIVAAQLEAIRNTPVVEPSTTITTTTTTPAPG